MLSPTYLNIGDRNWANGYATEALMDRRSVKTVYYIIANILPFWYTVDQKHGIPPLKLLVRSRNSNLLQSEAAPTCSIVHCKSLESNAIILLEELCVVTADLGVFSGCLMTDVKLSGFIFFKTDYNILKQQIVVRIERNTWCNKTFCFITSSLVYTSGRTTVWLQS